MKRIELAKYVGKTAIFSAVVSKKCLYENGDYALLMNIRDRDNRFLTDHVWVEITNELNRQKEGSQIKFKARVEEYSRVDGETDYGIRDILLLY